MADSMQDFAAIVRERAKRALLDNWECDDDVIRSIESAIYEAIEDLLMREPSVKAWEVFFQFGDISWQDRYRAMTAALLEEIRKERK